MALLDANGNALGMRVINWDIVYEKTVSYYDEKMDSGWFCHADQICTYVGSYGGSGRQGSDPLKHQYPFMLCHLLCTLVAHYITDNM
jgi:hypothetical protein